MARGHTIVVDSAFMIALGEISALHLLFENPKKMNIMFVIPDWVFREIFRKEHPYDKQIKEAIKIGSIQKISPPQDEYEKLRNRNPSLGRGELEALTIAKCGMYSNCILLFDDGDARKSASRYGFKYHGLIWFLENCCYCNVLDKNETLHLLEKVECSSFRIKKHYIQEAKQRIRNLQPRPRAHKQRISHATK